MSFEEFLQLHPSGTYINDDGTLGPNTPGGQAQCVNLANAWCAYLGIEQFPGNAGQFNFDSHPDCDWIPNTPTNAPEEGDIVVWDVEPGLPYGHVAIAQAGATVDSFNAYTQNWPLGSPCHSQAYSYLGPDVTGWLRPRLLHQAPAPAPAPAPPGPGGVHWAQPGQRWSGSVSARPSANVRSGAGTQNRVLYSAAYGQQLSFDGYIHTGVGIPDAITGQPDDRWFHVISDAREGWIASALVNGNPSF